MYRPQLLSSIDQLKIVSVQHQEVVNSIAGWLMVGSNEGINSGRGLPVS